MNHLAALPFTKMPEASPDLRTFADRNPLDGDGLKADFAALLDGQATLAAPNGGAELPEGGKTLPGPADAALSATGKRLQAGMAHRSRTVPEGEPALLQADPALDPLSGFAPETPESSRQNLVMSPPVLPALLPTALAAAPVIELGSDAAKAEAPRRSEASLPGNAGLAQPGAINLAAAPQPAALARHPVAILETRQAQLPAGKNEVDIAAAVHIIAPDAAPQIAAPVLRVMAGEAKPALPPALSAETAPLAELSPATAPQTPAAALVAADPRSGPALPVTVMPQAPADRPHDFATLVDMLVAAREAVAPATVRIALDHAEFGSVSLRFEQAGDRLDVAMASSDPAFARAVSAALPAQSTTSGDDPAASLGSQRGQADASPGSGQSRGNASEQRHEPREQPRAHSPSDRRSAQRPGTEHSGIFA